MDVDEAVVEVDVAVLERDPFAGAQAGGGGEQDHRPVDGSELGGEGVELGLRVEGVHLAARRLRVVDASLARVGVDETPLDGSRERLPQGLGGFEAVSGRNRHPPGGDLAWRRARSAASSRTPPLTW
ncbi:MAG: hypothetical protein ACRDPC_09690 [Solirubrobacteraceae bacterium]